MSAAEELAGTPPAPDVDRRIDLDAARKARREKQGPPPTIVLLEREFLLPQELPAEVLDMIDGIGAGEHGAVNSAARTLLGGDTYDELRQAAKDAGDPLMLDDVVFLLERALEVYEVTLPESKASPAPS